MAMIQPLAQLMVFIPAHLQSTHTTAIIPQIWERHIGQHHHQLIAAHVQELGT